MSTLQTVASKLVVAFNAMGIECLYSGVRVDAAMAAKVVPDAVFHAAWELLHFHEYGNGNIFASFDGQ